MRLVLLLALPALAACDSPSPRYIGLEPTRVTIEGTTFSIRQKAGEVEAIRVNAEAAPREGLIMVKAAAAIEQATGCPPVSYTMRGDTNVIRAVLDC
ncbi:putative lipoprotein [Candidatus Rhodobacter oscarellae]|uniref:Putative lipoprotein n=1 Tax=Candidatus Rhodobacter oscarellae TaxID=1675527 RepID=A0A0J9ECL0_9RHOB|nr:hypothetical protein [Candidatus Rhodobacter lobularis]KMW60396.1 putative lipoprotein [Candidatus Rhodobacter lobularis]